MSREIGDGPGKSQHLVHAAGAQPAAVHGFVDNLQTVRKRQVTPQIAAGDFAVGLPTATGQASTLPIARLQHPLGYHG